MQSLRAGRACMMWYFLRAIQVTCHVHKLMTGSVIPGSDIIW